MSDWLPLWIGPWLLKWAAVLAVPLVAFALFGVPHLRVSWDGFERVRGYVNYTRCDYLGPFGLWTAEPGRDVFETCPVFVQRPILDFFRTGGERE